MNPGYLSIILVCMTLILLASGWKEIILPGLSDRNMAWFLVSWIVLSWSTVPFPGSSPVTICLSVIPLVGFVLKASIFRTSWRAFLNFFSTGLFLAALYYLLFYFSIVDPLFFPYHSPSLAASFLGIVSVLIVRAPHGPLPVLTFALLAGAGLYTYVMYPNFSSSNTIYGGRAFQDQWWAAVVSARVASICVQSIRSFGTSTIKGWVSRNAGKNDEGKSE